MENIMKVNKTLIFIIISRRTCKIIVPADTAVAPLKKEAFF